MPRSHTRTDFHEIEVWETGNRLADVINCAKFFGDRFRGFDSGVEFWLSPLT